MKIGPKATQNHEKSTLESQEIQFLRKLIFAIPSMPNACFSNPRHRNLDPKTNRKSNLAIYMKNLFFGYFWIKKEVVFHIYFHVAFSVAFESKFGCLGLQKQAFGMEGIAKINFRRNWISCDSRVIFS